MIKSKSEVTLEGAISHDFSQLLHNLGLDKPAAEEVSFS